jgi:hypothetical protein
VQRCEGDSIERRIFFVASQGKIFGLESALKFIYSRNICPRKTESMCYLAPLCGAVTFALTALGHLYLPFALTLSTELGVAIFHAQAYIPT